MYAVYIALLPVILYAILLVFFTKTYQILITFDNAHISCYYQNNLNLNGGVAIEILNSAQNKFNNSGNKQSRFHLGRI